MNIFSLFKWAKKSEPEKKVLNPIIKENIDPNEKWEKIKAIGDGSFGEVYQIRNIDKGNYAAMKQVKHDNGEELEDALVEIDILTECLHKNIIQIYDVYLNKEILWIVMEFCDAGALDSIMIDLDKSLTENQIRFVCHEVVDGLSFLHQHWIIHRDLKAGNILLTIDGRVKLADFGVSAKNKEEKQKRSTYIGSTYWMAPEVINCETYKDDPYDYKADIWSLGITLIELAEMYPPHHEMNPMRASMKIYKSDPPTLKNSSKWSSNFHQFLTKCLIKQPDKRLTSEELKKQPFISTITEYDNSDLKLLIGEAKADVTVLEEDVESKPNDQEGDRYSIVSEKFTGDDCDSLVATPTSAVSNGTTASSSKEQLFISQPIAVNVKKNGEQSSVDQANDDVLFEIVDEIIIDVLASETRSPSVASVVLEYMQEATTTNIDDVVKVLDQTDKRGAEEKASGSGGFTNRRNSYNEARDDSNTMMQPAPPQSSAAVAAAAIRKELNENGGIKNGDETTATTTTTTQPSSLNRNKSRYRTLTRTRKFVFEGKEIVTQTTKVIDVEEQDKVQNEMIERRHETREMRLLAVVERREHEKFEQSCQSQRLNLANKAKQDEIQLQKHYEQEKEALMKDQKDRLDRLKAEHNNDLKQLLKSKKLEFAADERHFRVQQNNEVLQCKRTWSNLSRDERLQKRENLTAKQNEEIQQLHQSQTNALQELREQFNKKSIEKLADVEMQFMIARHKLIRDYETKRQQNEEMSLNSKQQLERQHTQGRFSLLRVNLVNRRDKELERMRGVMLKETEELTERQNMLRKSRPKEMEQMFKARREIYRKSLLLPPYTNLSPEEIKHKMKEFQRAEIERKQDDIANLEKRFAKQRDHLQRNQSARNKEVEQMYNEKQQGLQKKENEAMQDLDQLFRYQREQMKLETTRRKETLDSELNAELVRVKEFYLNSSSNSRGGQLLPESYNSHDFGRYFTQQLPGSWSRSNTSHDHVRPALDHGRNSIHLMSNPNSFGSPSV